jgi:hypothetical protein
LFSARSGASKLRSQGGPGEPIDSKSPHRIAAKVIE